MSLRHAPGVPDWRHNPFKTKLSISIWKTRMKRRIILALVLALPVTWLVYAIAADGPAGQAADDVLKEKIAPPVLKQIEPPKFMVMILGNPEGAESLWVVNAIKVKLTGEEIRKAAMMAEVKYIYPEADDSKKPKGQAKVSRVIEQAERTPFSHEGKVVPWNLKGFGALQTWDELKVTGEGAVVAMLDTGADYEHPDLINNIWINTREVPNSGKDDDGNGVVDDLYGYNFAAGSPEVKPAAGANHGLWTAGIVAGDGSSGTVTGVAPRARLMFVIMGGGFFQTAQSIQYVLGNGADVINMSFSIPNLGVARGVWRMMAENARHGKHVAPRSVAGAVQVDPRHQSVPCLLVEFHAQVAMRPEAAEIGLLQLFGDADVEGQRHSLSSLVEKHERDPWKTRRRPGGSPRRIDVRGWC